MDKEVKILVTTSPFGSCSPLPKKHLADYNVFYSNFDRKLNRTELVDMISSYQPDIIIAGTENYDSEIFNIATNLKMISRVGIGLDSIPLQECADRGIVVAHTPDAPSNAVAELTVGQMLNMLRKIQVVDRDMRVGGWQRYIGKELRDCNVGIIGCGRIGKLVIDKMQGLKPRRIFVNDIVYEKAQNLPRCEFATKMNILSTCDIISIHIPLSDDNKDYIGEAEFEIIKKDAILINMSRGGIINEGSLFNFLKNNPEASASVDVYLEEPYKGELTMLPNAFVTPHLGSCSVRSRIDMEMGAAERAVDFIKNKTIANRVV